MFFAASKPLRDSKHEPKSLISTGKTCLVTLWSSHNEQSATILSLGPSLNVGRVRHSAFITVYFTSTEATGTGRNQIQESKLVRLIELYFCQQATDVKTAQFSLLSSTNSPSFDPNIHLKKDASFEERIGDINSIWPAAQKNIIHCTHNRIIVLYCVGTTYQRSEPII